MTVSDDKVRRIAMGRLRFRWHFQRHPQPEFLGEGKHFAQYVDNEPPSRAEYQGTHRRVDNEPRVRTTQYIKCWSCDHHIIVDTNHGGILLLCDGCKREPIKCFCTPES